MSTSYLYDGLQLIGEYSSTGALVRRYIPGASLDEPLVIYDGTNAATRTWLYADERGSITAAASATGTLLSAYSYGPFGEPNVTTGVALRYTGQRLDPESGLSYYRARWYSPYLGRFLSPDPIGLDGGTHLYRYVANDPINNSDPTGLYRCRGSVKECAAIEQYRQKMLVASKSNDIPSSARRALERTAAMLGGPNDRNGINVRFGSMRNTTDDGFTSGMDITINRSAFSSNDLVRGAQILAHEGVHVAQNILGQPGTMPADEYNLEIPAYAVDYYAAKGLGVNPSPGMSSRDYITGGALASCYGATGNYNSCDMAYLNWGRNN